MINILISDGPLLFIIVFLCLIAALSIHEFAHAFMADKLGDPTPRLDGRYTLNPKAHLDPLGTLALILFGFGWGKPVIFDPYNLKNPRKDAALISLAGPTSNFIMAVASSILLRILNLINPVSIFVQIIEIFIYFNLILGIFNLIPFHPLDGGKIFVGFLPDKDAQEAEIFLRKYGLIILIFLIFPILGGVSPFWKVVSPVINFLLNLLVPGRNYI